MKVTICPPRYAAGYVEGDIEDIEDIGLIPEQDYGLYDLANPVKPLPRPLYKKKKSNARKG